MPQDRQTGTIGQLGSLLRAIGKPFFVIFLYLFIFLVTLGSLLTRLVSHLPSISYSFRIRLSRRPTRVKTKPTPPSLRHRRLFRLGFSLALMLLIIGALAGGFYLYLLRDLPHPRSLLAYRPPVSTRIYARDGQLLYQVYGDQNRTLIALNQLPRHLVQATLAIEDAEFYDHPGFSLKGISRAFFRNLKDEDSLQGGSTITQQLIKNTLLTPDKTYKRKLQELILAVAIEHYFTKDEILSMYLNQVGFGGTAYGIEAASQQYFGKSARDLTVAESALLAGLPAAPTIYSPFGAHPEGAITRQHEVLRRMVQENYLTASAAETAKTTPLTFASPSTNIRAPHFVMYIKDLLAQTYGEKVVSQGGLEVTTSLDLNLQSQTETIVREELLKLQKMHVTNAAVLITKPSTGEIVTMVGSRDYFDTASDGQVNVTLRPRQPGSSIKVITYTLALEKGFTPTTIIEDSPVTYKLPGSPAYSPKNYDGTYHGKVPLRQALGSSYNIPAVKTLSQLGVTSMLDKAAQMGITTWTDPSRYGLSLTLGGGEVKMVDMAVVYGTLANLGTRVDLNPIIKVTDYIHRYDKDYTCIPKPGWATAQAAPTNEPPCPGKVVVDPQVAYLMTDILSDNHARTPAFGSHSLLNLPGQAVAVKTGTTNSLRDNWTIGYTPDYLVAVWVGNNDNTPMSRIASGVTGASAIWNRAMSAVLAQTPHEKFEPPPGLVKVTVCGLTGSLTCSACPNPREEYFVSGTQPQEACNDQIIQTLLNPTPTHSLPFPRDQILEGLSTDQDTEVLPLPTSIRPTPTPPSFNLFNPLPVNHRTRPKKIR